MTRVRKYSLGDKGGTVRFAINVDSKWLSANIQLGCIYIYLVDTDAPVKRVRQSTIRIVATDTDLDAGLPPGRFNSFLFTVNDGPLVWHLFEELDESTRNLSTV